MKPKRVTIPDTAPLLKGSVVEVPNAVCVVDKELGVKMLLPADWPQPAPPAPRMVWDTEEVPRGFMGDPARKRLLADGWEPFAVEGGMMFFRKQVPA